jgi:hypothetical protein
MNPPGHNLYALRAKALGSSRAGWMRLLYPVGLGEEALVADVNEVERALTGAIEKRMLEGSGKLGKVTTVDGILQVTFLGVTDDAHVGGKRYFRRIFTSRSGTTSNWMRKSSNAPLSVSNSIVRRTPPGLLGARNSDGRDSPATGYLDQRDAAPCLPQFPFPQISSTETLGPDRQRFGSPPQHPPRLDAAFFVCSDGTKCPSGRIFPRS